MSSSRSIAAIASLPHTLEDGSRGTGRSISLLAASAGFADGTSIVSSLDWVRCGRLRRIPPARTRAVVTAFLAFSRSYPAPGGSTTMGENGPRPPSYRPTGPAFGRPEDRLRPGYAGSPRRDGARSLGLTPSRA